MGFHAVARPVFAIGIIGIAALQGAVPLLASTGLTRQANCEAAIKLQTAKGQVGVALSWLAKELNQLLCDSIAKTLPDPLARYPGLDNFDIYASDGHWHGAAAHDIRLDGANYAVGHVYSRDLRHLDVGHSKKEHDMQVLKRLEIYILRPFVSKGRKVIQVWDKAVSISLHGTDGREHPVSISSVPRKPT